MAQPRTTRRALFAWVVAAITCAPLVVRGDALLAIEEQQQDIARRATPSVVFLRTACCFGSGFFVSRDGLILTNAHVVRGASTVKVVTAAGKTFDGVVVDRAADEIDLAFVRVPTHDAVPLVLAKDDRLRVGSWVAAVGHGSGGVWSFNVGMVSNIYPHEGQRPFFQTQIPLRPGNSGGPVVDRLGRVVGIVTARSGDAESMNFAIRSSVAIEAMARRTSSSRPAASPAEPIDD